MSYRTQLHAIQRLHALGATRVRLGDIEVEFAPPPPPPAPWEAPVAEDEDEDAREARHLREVLYSTDEGA